MEDGKMAAPKFSKQFFKIHRNAVNVYLSCFSLFLVCVSIFAGDGQIDILPTGLATCAISTSGSYVLVDNVTMKADVNCIEITTDDVTLDLNGHTIAGNGSHHYGISGSTINRAVILNGTIRNFGNMGIHIGASCRIKEVILDSNGGHGIETGDGCVLTGVISINNSNYGIKTGNDCIIEKCEARFNSGGVGIETLSHSTVKDCIACNNSILSGNAVKNVYGIHALDGCAIINNSCYKNENASAFDEDSLDVCGIRVRDACNVINNTCFENKGTKTYKSCYGIRVTSQCNVKGNTCTNNDGTLSSTHSYGICCYTSCIVKDNTCSGNSSGGVGSGIYSTGASNLITGNICDDNDGIAGSYGIMAYGSSTRVENNLCTGNNVGTYKSGIGLASGSHDCVIIRNTTCNNGTGIDLDDKDVYCAENMCADGVINTSGATLGTGDRSNVGF